MPHGSKDVDQNDIGVDGVFFYLLALLGGRDSLEPVFDVCVFDKLVNYCLPYSIAECYCFVMSVGVYGFNVGS
jgi:hypothetical protein